MHPFDPYHPGEVMATPPGRRRDRELRQWLCSQPHDDCFAFITRCLAFTGPYASKQRVLDLAASCIRQPAHTLAILRSGLANPDVSTIKFWLAFAIPKIGGKIVIREIAPLLEGDPIIADKTLYWLKKLLPRKDKAEWKLLRVRQDTKKRSVLRQPAIGSVLDHESD